MYVQGAQTWLRTYCTLRRAFLGPHPCSHQIINNRIKNNYYLTGLEKGDHFTQDIVSLLLNFLFLLLVLFVVVVCCFLSALVVPFPHISCDRLVSLFGGSNGGGSVWHQWWQCTGHQQTAVAGTLRMEVVLTMVAVTSTIGAQK